MTYFDVFNGDADGICALHQLRLANPKNSTLVTGVKRDIALLKRVNATTDDVVTVLDISLDKNRDELLRVLAEGAHVTYFDHHYAGDIPSHERLDCHIDTDPEICSSLLVNAHLEGRYLTWAVTAAFGDNLDDSARTAAAPLNLSQEQLDALKLLGTCINYNSYGSSLEDLLIPPAELYRLLEPYENPFDFIEQEARYTALQEGYRDDMTRASELKPTYQTESHALYILPNEKWARRVSGIYANEMALRDTQRAHAFLTEKADSGYLVSVRAPLARKTGADELCRQFETGGGRKAAAGINHLPSEDYERFLGAFKQSFLA